MLAQIFTLHPPSRLINTAIPRLCGSWTENVAADALCERGGAKAVEVSPSSLFSAATGRLGSIQALLGRISSEKSRTATNCLMLATGCVSKVLGVPFQTLTTCIEVRIERMACKFRA